MARVEDIRRPRAATGRDVLREITFRIYNIYEEHTLRH
jgi:hypothetical protein